LDRGVHGFNVCHRSNLVGDLGATEPRFPAVMVIGLGVDRLRRPLRTLSAVLERSATAGRA